MKPGTVLSTHAQCVPRRPIPSRLSPSCPPKTALSGDLAEPSQLWPALLETPVSCTRVENPTKREDHEQQTNGLPRRPEPPQSQDAAGRPRPRPVTSHLQCDVTQLTPAAARRAISRRLTSPFDVTRWVDRRVRVACCQAGGSSGSRAAPRAVAGQVGRGRAGRGCRQGGLRAGQAPRAAAAAIVATRWLHRTRSNVTHHEAAVEGREDRRTSAN